MKNSDITMKLRLYLKMLRLYLNRGLFLFPARAVAPPPLQIRGFIAY